MAKPEVIDVYRERPKYKGKTLKLTLPVPPSVNAIYYNTKGGGRRLTAKAEMYIRTARALINEAIMKQKWIQPEKNVWLYIDMVYYFPDRRIRDASNCLKLLLDVMEGNVYANDYIALPRIQSVEYDKAYPRVEIKVSIQTESGRDKGKKIVD